VIEGGEIPVIVDTACSSDKEAASGTTVKQQQQRAADLAV